MATMKPPANNYTSSLTQSDRECYFNKLCLANGNQLPDPYSLNNGWSSDIEQLPSLTWRDVTTYLIDTPSTYTKECLKAYKSLDAYNYFLSGHVQACHLYMIPDEDFCFVKSEVLPSQRQGKSSTMYDVWVCINKQHGWILTANCTCMAGLGSACSHVAALLFKLETAVHLQLNQPAASTSKLCLWKACKRFVEPAPLSQIIFKRPKKGSLPNVKPQVTTPSKNFSTNDPTIGDNAIDIDDFRNLMEVYPQAAALTSLDIECGVTMHNLSDTESETENDETCLPEPLTSLFDPTLINVSESDLRLKSINLYELYQSSYTQQTFDNLCEITKKQSESSIWMLHRAGRITASVCHQVYHTNEENPSKSLLRTLMQYSGPMKNKYTEYGKNMEDTAKAEYVNSLQTVHQNLTVLSTGFHVRRDKVFMGASPDGIVSCKCHPKKLLEIKCPYKYKDGLVDWENDSDFPLNSDFSFKKNHKYYAQVQLQMLICDFQNCDFMVYTPSQSIICEVVRNDEFLQDLESKCSRIFFNTILPEIVSRKNDADAAENARKVYCSCKRPSFPPMIACEDPTCNIEWFHYSCVMISRAPKGKWFCDLCKMKRKPLVTEQ